MPDTFAISTIMCKTPVETIGYPRALYHRPLGQFVTKRLGHFVTQAYSLNTDSLPIVDRRDPWKTLRVSAPPLGPTTAAHVSFPKNQNKNLPMKGKTQ